MKFPSDKDFEPYYPEIGRAILAWATLEIKFDELLLSMLRHENASAKRMLLGITKVEDIPRAFGSRLLLCNELATLYYKGEALKELQSITKACRGQYRTRNRLAHGEWLIHFSLLGKPPPRIVCKMRRFGVQDTERQFTLKQIKNLTQTYHKLTQRIVEFRGSHDPNGPLGERLKQFFRIRMHNHTTEGHPPTPAEHPETP